MLLDSAGGPTLGVRFGMTGGLVVDGDQALDRLLYGPGVFMRSGCGPRSPLPTVVICPCTIPGFRITRARAAERGAIGSRRVVGDPARTRRRAAEVGAGRSAAPLKARLLDQARLAGVGNFLADEVLWRAGLSPERRTPLSEAEVRDLHRRLCAVPCANSPSGAGHTWATSWTSATF